MAELPWCQQMYALAFRPPNQKGGITKLFGLAAELHRLATYDQIARQVRLLLQQALQVGRNLNHCEFGKGKFRSTKDSPRPEVPAAYYAYIARQDIVNYQSKKEHMQNISWTAGTLRVMLSKIDTAI